MRIAFFIISLLFFLSWMIMSIIRADVWIAILAGVMVLRRSVGEFHRLRFVLLLAHGT